jgi:hypothetical protein
MRFSMAILGCLFACGCVAHQRSQVSDFQPACQQQADGPALALACDPPVIAGQPALYLDRESREPAAFAGYDQPTVTYSYLRVEDRYNPDNQGKYVRDSVTERIGVNTR